MIDESYKGSTLRMSPPRQWQRVENEIPTWVSPDGAMLMYALQSPPIETRGCTTESHVVWFRTLLEATVCRTEELVEIHGGECRFGVFARARCNDNGETSYYWYLHDREDAGVLVQLRSANSPEDVRLGEEFARSIYVAPLGHDGSPW
jgi:hypothetical protein